MYVGEDTYVVTILILSIKIIIIIITIIIISCWKLQYVAEAITQITTMTQITLLTHKHILHKIIIITIISFFTNLILSYVRYCT